MQRLPDDNCGNVEMEDPESKDRVASTRIRLLRVGEKRSDCGEDCAIG